MKLKLNLQPSGADISGTDALRRHWRVIAAFLCWLSVTNAEPSKSLVTPSIIPLQEIPNAPTSSETGLGFTGAPAEGEEKPPADGDSNPPPEAPETLPAPEATFTVDGSTPPFAAEDPALSESEQASQEPGEAPEKEETSPESSDADFSNNVGSPPQWEGGLPSSPAMGGARPSGFANTPANMPLGGSFLGGLREGLDFAVSLTGAYDTNPSRGYVPTGETTEGDFFTGLIGTVNYLSRASTWTYGARYTGGYTQYFKQSELSGYNQNAGASLNYNGGSLSASLNVGVDFGSGANRYYESVVDEISYRYGLNARYRISKKTSLTGNISQSITSSSGDIERETESFDMGASALWQYSQLTEFGPGIRYTMRSSDSAQERTSIGPTATVNYKLSEKVSLNSRVGMDFAQYENGENADPSLYTSINLIYNASPMWGMSLSLLRDTQASYTTPGDFEESLSLRVGYGRKIRRAILNLGAGWEMRSTENSTATSSTDREFLTLSAAIGMPIIADQYNASVFTLYSEESGNGTQSWDSLVTGFSISRKF